MEDPGASQYMGNWNMNADYLKYMAYLITRTGAYAEQENVKGWHLVLEEIYRDTGGICEKTYKDAAGNIRPDSYKGRLNAIKLEIAQMPMMAANNAAIINITIKQAQILAKLDEWQIGYIAEMHKHNLILPKKDIKRGLKQIEEQFGIYNDPE